METLLFSYCKANIIKNNIAFTLYNSIQELSKSKAQHVVYNIVNCI